MELQAVKSGNMLLILKIVGITQSVTTNRIWPFESDLEIFLKHIGQLRSYKQIFYRLKLSYPAEIILRSG